jgi:hypothetical protein
VAILKAENGLIAIFYTAAAATFIRGNLTGIVGLNLDGDYNQSYIFWWHVYYVGIASISVWVWWDERQEERREQAAKQARATKGVIEHQPIVE